MKKLFLLFLLLILPFFLSGCVSSEYANELESKIEELEETNADLETENKELKEKLDDIQSVAISRGENYSDILDDIEQKSLY